MPKLLVLHEYPPDAASIKLLTEHLFPDAGLVVSEWDSTSVFQSAPPHGDFKHWTGTKTDLKKLGHAIPSNPINKRYLLPAYQGAVDSTVAAIREANYDLILCLGSLALWAVTGEGRVGTFRGTLIPSPWGTGKVFASYAPGAVQKNFKFYPVVWNDLGKIRRFLDGKLPSPLRRRLVYSPTETELESVYRTFRLQPHLQLGVDIETVPSLGQITTISFGTPTLAICIPIWDKYTGKPVAPTPKAEVQIWRWIDRYAKLENPKVLQNGKYDMQYLLDAPLPIRLTNVTDDTSIMQHAYQPELPKDLGTLASLYVNEPCWKQMRVSTKDAKAEE